MKKSPTVEIKYAPLTLLLLAGQLGFGKLNVERNVQVALLVVVLVVGHALGFLSHNGARPRDLLAAHFHFVLVKMLDLHVEAVERLLQANCHVRVQIVAFPLKPLVSFIV